MMANEITHEQLEEYCKKRHLVVVTFDYFQALRQPNGPKQAFIEQARAYETKITRQSHEIEMLNATVIELTKCATRARVKYDNIKSLLNRYIATGLMPGYFDIYNQLCETKVKLKDARKEAAAANKRYKQLKKEFARYRNKHTDSDYNGRIQCEDCASSYKDTTSDGVDILYCCATPGDKCICVSDVRVCPGFKPKEENYESSEDDAT